MAVQLTGEGGLFARLGLWFQLLEQINANQSLGIVQVTNLIAAQYNNNRALVDSLYTQLAASQAGMLGFAATVQSQAENTVIEMVNTDNPQPDLSLGTALIELIRQMDLSDSSVEPNTIIAAIVADVANDADAQIVVSLKDKYGKPLQNIFSEDVVITCTQDAQEGGAALGSELLSGLGEAPLANPLDYSWPQGSQSSSSYQAVNAELSNSGGNLLTNGSFSPSNFATTSHVAGHWVYEVGSPEIQSELTSSMPSCISAGALGFIGDGVSLTAISQKFGDATNGTPSILGPLRQYAFNGWIGLTATPADGMLRIELVHTVTDEVVYDDYGTPNYVDISLAGADADCVPVNFTFRTPRILATSPVKLRIKLTTPLSAGSTLILDHLAVTEMVEQYPSGPSFAIFSGKSFIARSDFWTVTFHNDRQGTYQTLFDRCFDMKSLRLQLPLPHGSTGPSLDDSVPNDIPQAGGATTLFNLPLG